MSVCVRERERERERRSIRMYCQLGQRELSTQVSERESVCGGIVWVKVMVSNGKSERD